MKKVIIYFILFIYCLISEIVFSLIIFYLFIYYSKYERPNFFSASNYSNRCTGSKFIREPYLSIEILFTFINLITVFFFFFHGSLSHILFPILLAIIRILFCTLSLMKKNRNVSKWNISFFFFFAKNDNIYRIWKNSTDWDDHLYFLND